MVPQMIVAVADRDVEGHPPEELVQVGLNVILGPARAEHVQEAFAHRVRWLFQDEMLPAQTVWFKLAEITVSCHPGASLRNRESCVLSVCN